jgi:hypothetical protein
VDPGDLLQGLGHGYLNPLDRLCEPHVLHGCSRPRGQVAGVVQVRLGDPNRRKKLLLEVLYILYCRGILAALEGRNLRFFIPSFRDEIILLDRCGIVA